MRRANEFDMLERHQAAGAGQAPVQAALAHQMIAPVFPSNSDRSARSVIRRVNEFDEVFELLQFIRERFIEDQNIVAADVHAARFGCDATQPRILGQLVQARHVDAVKFLKHASEAITG